MTLGFRASGPTFADLDTEPLATRGAVLVLDAATKIAGAWTDEGASVYSTIYADADQEAAKDAHSVYTTSDGNEPGHFLTRVYSLDECIAKGRTYFYDFREAQRLGAGNTSPTGPKLYVHRKSNTSPITVDVYAITKFAFGTHAGTFDVLGPELLNVSFSGAQMTAGGGFEVWPHLQVGTGNHLQSEKYRGPLSRYSILYGEQAGVSGSAVMDIAIEDFSGTDIALVGGQEYRLSGIYATDAGASPPTTVGLHVAFGTNIMRADGVSFVSGPTPDLAPTNGRARRFAFDFRMPFTTTAIVRPNVSEFIYFDDFSLRAIEATIQVEPRLISGDLSIEASDPLFGKASVGAGPARLLNGADGRLEALFGKYVVIGQKATVYLSGAVGGQQLPSDALPPILASTVDGFEGEEEFLLNLIDQRGQLSYPLPFLSTYNLTSFPNMDQRDIGRPRPLLFGAKTKIRPTRITLSPLTFEVAQTGFTSVESTLASPPATRDAGLVGIGPVYTYPNEDSAQSGANQTTVPTGQYTVDLVSGRFTVTNTANIGVDLSGELILRCDATGYGDGPTTSHDHYWTGITDLDAINKAPDILHFVCDAVLKRPDLVDHASFFAARSFANQTLGVYIGTLAIVNEGLGTEITLQDLIDALEFSCGVDIRLEPDGKLHFRERGTEPPIVVEEPDFFTFSSRRTRETVYRSIRINYNQHPATGIPLWIEQSPSRVEPYSVTTKRVINTYLLTSSDADSALIKLGNTERPANEYRFSCRGFGRLMLAAPGAKVDISRRVTRVPSYPDETTFGVGRLLSLRVDYVNWIVDAELLEGKLLFVPYWTLDISTFGSNTRLR